MPMKRLQRYQNTIFLKKLSHLADNPPQDSSPDRIRNIIIVVVVVALGLLLLTLPGTVWWRGYVGNRISKEEGEVI